MFLFTLRLQLTIISIIELSSDYFLATRLKHRGDRAFAAVAPKLWNELGRGSPCFLLAALLICWMAMVRRQNDEHFIFESLVLY